jgi:ribose/xylose/arabinose/galactoside ABC-type transport system permease subunit
MPNDDMTLYMLQPATARTRPEGAPLRLLGRFAPLLVLVVIGLVFASINPVFASAENARNILFLASVLLIASCGQTFVILMGSIDLSVGAVATLAGVVAALTVPGLGYGALVFASVVGFALGLVNGLLYVYLRIPSILVTLGTATSLVGVILYLCDGGSVPIRDQAYIAMTQREIIPYVPLIVAFAVAVYAICVLIGERTRFGRMTLAIGSDEQTTALVGVSVNLVKIQAFALSGGVCGLGGALLASRLGTATGTMGDFLMLETITAVVVGGTAITGGSGGVARTLLGVLFVAMLSNGMNIVAVHPYLQTIIKGGVILLAVVAMKRASVNREVN